MRERTAIERAIQANGFLIRTVRGISMLPMLDQKRDAVRLVALNGRCRRHDVILYRRANGTFVLHRVIEVKDGGYLVRGDNCIHKEWVREDQLMAVAEGIYKNGTYYPCDSAFVKQFATYQEGTLPIRTLRYYEYVLKRKGRSAIRRTKGLFSSLFVTDEGGSDVEQGDSKGFEVSVELSYLVSLLAATVCDFGAPSVPEGIDFSKLYALARKHSITATVFAKLREEEVPAEIYSEWQGYTLATLRRSLLFDAERRELLLEFERQKIDYLPLKGILLKDLYAMGTREFADNDILVHPQDARTVWKLMLSRGYEGEESSVHDGFKKKPVYNFEIHKRLFEVYLPYAKAFEDIFKRAVKDSENGYGYHMTDEDFYVYNITHFFKHFDNAGAGLRSFADFFLMRRKFEHLEGFRMDYVRELLHRAGITEFYEYLCHVTEAMFQEHPALERVENLRYITESGVYGKFDNVIKNGIRRDGRGRFILYRLFPDYSIMCRRYPVLIHVPILVPVMYIVRVVQFLMEPQKRDATLRAIR